LEISIANAIIDKRSLSARCASSPMRAVAERD
jgi:hypothetical protein